MPTSYSHAKWNGTLKKGTGTFSFTGYEGPFTFASRFEDGKETNPEELLGAAHAGCFSQFLAGLISEKDLTPEIETKATVHLGKDDTGPVIKTIELSTKVKCEGLSQDDFDELAAKAKENCPVSRLFKGAEVKLEATLL